MVFLCFFRAKNPLFQPRNVVPDLQEQKGLLLILSTPFYLFLNCHRHLSEDVALENFESESSKDGVRVYATRVFSIFITLWNIFNDNTSDIL